MQPIYLDNAASTRIADEVLALVTEVQRTAWGNPSAQHPQGAAARAHIAAARHRMLAALGDRGAGDVLWTSGCSEANALAVLGAARVRPGKLVTTTFEHPAIATLADRLAAEGREIVRVAPERDGVIDPDAFAAAAADAAVVSFVAVQNEIGVVQPVASLIAAARAAAPSAHIHVDAAQALGKIALDVASGFDSLSIAGHKLHGPKGVGALWLRSSARIEPLWVGGGQQHGLRGGTQDAPSTAGLGLAAERAVGALTSARARWLEFARDVMAALAARGVTARQLVPDHRRAPHILSIAIAGVPASALRNVLASRGVYVSTGSACADADTKKSHVLEAIGLPPADGMVRLSFGLDTTADDVARAAEILAEVASSLAKR
ncbi:MAG TPA: aminotransferase class V-fold PLP-dependent enzyme [Kofleriaceae bacterium]|jgi:cysteine desulfurase